MVVVLDVFPQAMKELWGDEMRWGRLWCVASHAGWLAG